jgi:E3 ubiquitin-protein ligase makorin
VYVHISFQIFKRQQLRHGHDFFGAASDTELAEHLVILQGIIGDPTNNIHITLDYLRRHLPAIWNSMDTESGTATDTPEGEDILEDDGDHQALELLVRHFDFLVA